MGPDVWLEGRLHEGHAAFRESLPGGPWYSRGPGGLGVIHLGGGGEGGRRGEKEGEERG